MEEHAADDPIDTLAVLGHAGEQLRELLGGVLDPHRVDQRVWDVLRDLFGTNVRNLIRPLVTREGSSAMAYYRRSLSFEPTASPPSLSAAAAEPPAVPQPDPPPAERDALDRLFLGED